MSMVNMSLNQEEFMLILDAVGFSSGNSSRARALSTRLEHMRQAHVSIHNSASIQQTGSTGASHDPEITPEPLELPEIEADDEDNEDDDDDDSRCDCCTEHWDDCNCYCNHCGSDYSSCRYNCYPASNPEPLN